MRILMILTLAALVGGCSCSPAEPEAQGVDLEPVIGRPVSGVCLPLPFGCDLCLGVDCEIPGPTPATFYVPVEQTPVVQMAPAAPASAPCDPWDASAEWVEVTR